MQIPDPARARLAYVVLGSAALLACAPAPPPPLAEPSPPPAMSPGEVEAALEGDYTQLDGSWHSSFGPVQISFDDATHFRGIYPKGSFAGRVDVERAELSFEWHDDHSGGQGVWVIADPETLVGTWGHGESAEDGGAWNLTR